MLDTNLVLNDKKMMFHHETLVSYLHTLTNGLDLKHLDIPELCHRVLDRIQEKMEEEQFHSLLAETAAYSSSIHPDYSILAARILMNWIHKNTVPGFSENIRRMFYYKDKITGDSTPLLAEDVYQIIMANAVELDRAIVSDRDFQYDFFGLKTLEKSYLLKMDGKIAERPQQMLLRVAVGIHKDDIASALRTYHLMGEKWFIHASPTLFNSATPKPQMSSCFLLTMKDDSIEGIYDTLKQCALISQSAGGIGLSIHNIRAKGTFIKGTNGESNGIVPMLRVFNDTARYVDQGGGKRKGAFAIYLEPWHGDIFEFLELKKNHGKEELRARDLFYALWVNDLFMKRVEADDNWSLFCPQKCPGLSDTHSEAFNRLYTQYEKEGRAIRVVKARDLWFKILESQIESGTPYMLYKDAANSKSNQKHLGTIKSSNLCTEIIQYTSSDEVAVCNLASLALPRYVKENGKGEEFDFLKLREITAIVTQNLNRIIDRNFYPVPEARRSNFRHRPIGIGVQGLADTFFKMKMAFDSPEAARLNHDIFETIYFSAMEASCELAKVHGPYETFQGSPLSQGQFQFDLWGVKPSQRWDWEGLRKKIALYGVRNSLLVAPMPTASTSQILGNNECIEPITSNIYTRRVLAGEFTIVNKYLVADLLRLNLWNQEMKEKIITHNGSVQEIPEIPGDLKEIYKTVWEIKQKTLIDMAAARSPYIDQSQSLNIFMRDTSFEKLSSMHFYAWKLGLKTGMYYLRTRPAAEAIKFTIPSEQKFKTEAATPPASVAATAAVCSLNPGGEGECLSCGS